MQYLPTTNAKPQLSLFEGLIAHGMPPFLAEPPPPQLERLSELSLSGNSEHCRLLLAPMLRELSDAPDSRWLTLVAPPAFLSSHWLRETGLNRERIILLQPRGIQGALELTCKALTSGCSHTVVSWFAHMDARMRSTLHGAASLGNAQSLNIRLGR
ncbi:SOS-induced cell division inhibitor SulA [Stutzerimonas stutzeri]|uniref:SOS-induced cell division inhibitor SulA n=1 Tax=Stutzerimonas stutzeri TaxID=316 RepID=UPI001BCD062F|nr:SOS-induced cell division inhibitor SulA [Stutzerimonas stutzeri]